MTDGVAVPAVALSWRLGPHRPGSALAELRVTLTGTPVNGSSADETAEGTHLRLDGTRLWAVGPVRDVVVEARGRTWCRARGDELLFDLRALPAPEPTLWDQATFDAAAAADETAVPRHRYAISPDPAVADEPVTAELVAPGAVTAGLRWWTEGPAAQHGVVAMTPRTDDPSRWTASIPAQPAGTVVRYALAADTGAGSVEATDAAPTYVAPRPGLTLVRPPRTRFSYRVAPGGPPDWARNAVGYHLLVDRFATDDGSAPSGSDLDMFAFAGGTLRGARRRLDHVVALGVDVVLLSPITPGEMHCAYDVKDLTGVDDRLGSVADARAFCADAHAASLRVLLDLELSYLGGNHPAARRALLDPRSPEAGWFHHDDAGGLWGWIGGHPMFRPVDHFDDGARRALLDSVGFWIDLGFDGFRLDSAQSAPLDFWTDFGAVVERANPDAFTFGEVTLPWPQPAQVRGRLHGYAHFDLERALRSLARGDDGAEEAIEAAVADAAAEPDVVPVTFAECHDDDRLSFVAGGDEDRIRSTLDRLLALPGLALLLHGTEVGVDQRAAGHLDAAVRLPMDWSIPNPERLEFVKDRIAARKARG